LETLFGPVRHRNGWSSWIKDSHWGIQGYPCGPLQRRLSRIKGPFETASLKGFEIDPKLDVNAHGMKGFVIPTKSFVKIGLTKIFCYNKMFSSMNKTFGCCGKIFGCSNKKKYLLSLILLP